MQYVLTEEEYNTLMQRAGDPESIKKEIDKAVQEGLKNSKIELTRAESKLNYCEIELTSERKDNIRLSEQIKYFHDQVEFFNKLPWYKRIIFKFNF